MVAVEEGVVVEERDGGEVHEDLDASGEDISKDESGTNEDRRSETSDGGEDAPEGTI